MGLDSSGRAPQHGEGHGIEAPPRWGYLVRLVAVPMGAAGVASIVSALLVGNDLVQAGLIELAATCLGVLATVFYVEIVLERHEARRWSRMASLIDHRVKRTAVLRTTSIVSLRPDYPYGVSRDVFGRAVNGDLSLSPLWIELVEGTVDSVPTLLTGLDELGWKIFNDALESISSEYTEVVSLFGDKLPPDVYYSVWQTWNTAEDVLSTIRYFSIERMPSVMASSHPFAEPEQVNVGIHLLPQRVEAILQSNLQLAQRGERLECARCSGPAAKSTRPRL